MQSKSKTENQIEGNPYNISASTVCGEPWWRSAGYSSISPAAMRGNASNSSSLERSIDGQSQSDGGFNEDDEEATKESDNTAPSSEGNYGQGHGDPHHVASNIPPRSDESITQTPQFELVGHSIACASNPYCDPYYGGMMAAYGQPLVYPPHLLNMHHQPRVPLPLEMAPEPVFVNAKQYNGILRRRQSRAKAELEKKLIKDRKPYLHESRHQHAMRRARASGGRFAKKSNVDDSSNTGEEKGTTGCSSSGTEHSQPTYVNNNGRCENRDGFEASAYGAERGEGNSGGQQQWAPQRAVAMQ